MGEKKNDKKDSYLVESDSNTGNRKEKMFSSTKPCFCLVLLVAPISLFFILYHYLHNFHYYDTFHSILSLKILEILQILLLMFYKWYVTNHKK